MTDIRNFARVVRRSDQTRVGGAFGRVNVNVGIGSAFYDHRVNAGTRRKVGYAPVNLNEFNIVHRDLVSVGAGIEFGSHGVATGEYRWAVVLDSLGEVVLVGISLIHVGVAVELEPKVGRNPDERLVSERVQVRTIHISVDLDWTRHCLHHLRTGEENPSKDDQGEGALHDSVL